MANTWLPLKTTTGPVRHIHVTRPGPYNAPPEPHGRMVYVLFNRPPNSTNTGTTGPEMVIWSPQSDPPQYIVAEKYRDEEASAVGKAPIMGVGQGRSQAHRYLQVDNMRGRAELSPIALPPGYSRISLFMTGHDPGAGGSNSNGALFVPRVHDGQTVNAFTWYHQWENGDPASGHRMVDGVMAATAGATCDRGQHVGGFNNAAPKHWTPWNNSNHIPSTDFLGQAGTSTRARMSWRNYDDVKGLRGYHSYYAPYPNYRPGYLWLPINDDGTHGPGVAGPDILPPEQNTDMYIHSNEYVWFGTTLYYWPYSADVPGYGERSDEWVPFEHWQVVTGFLRTLPFNAFYNEAFDTYWLILEGNTADWRLYYRDDSNKALYHPYTIQPDMVSYLDDLLGTGWVGKPPISTTNITTECAFVVRDSADNVYRLMLVRRNGTWEDISGNIWDDFEGAPALYPQVTTKRHQPTAIRHVLSSEYDPFQ